MDKLYRSNNCNLPDTIKFQIIDWESRTRKEENSDNNENSEENQISDEYYDIHLFGLTPEKQSVHLKISDFTPYFYIEIPKEWNRIKLVTFVNFLKERVKYSNRYKGCEDFLISYKFVKRHKFYGFTNNELFNFVCLIFKNKRGFDAFKSILNYKLKKIGLFNGEKKFEQYESNIDPMLRFMHIQELKPCGWVEISKGKFKKNIEEESTCQIDICAKFRNVKYYDSDQLCPFIVASFDIECTSGDGSFPEAKRKSDKIIQIGTTVREYGNPNWLIKHIITLGSCDPIDDVIVESYETEKEVLLAWTKFILKLDPDIIIGYNIFGFDFKYMYERSKQPYINCQDEFSQLGRFKDEECEIEVKRLSSAALGDNTMYIPKITGRVLIDIFKVIQRDHKLTSYKLDNVANTFMKQNKIDLPPNKIFEYQKIDSKHRNIIAEYCIQDCALVNNLTDKLNIIVNNIGMANVCSVPLSFIFLRGQGIKVFSLVAKYCKNLNYLIPVIQSGEEYFRKKNQTLFQRMIEHFEIKYREEFKDSEFKKKFDNDMCELEVFLKEKEKNKWNTYNKEKKTNTKNTEYFSDIKKYEGATVLDPFTGFYDDPISVCDFSSLYPSCMISKNLSHDTFVIKGSKYDNLPNVIYNSLTYKNPSTGQMEESRFAFAKRKRGIIPQILMNLLSERKKFKKLMNKEEDPFKKSILDGVQLALKVTCNSVYGQCGASTSQIYLKDVAASTTAEGRNLLLFSKEFVEEKFGAKCVYGDTDSIFIRFKIDKEGKTEKQILQESIDLGIDAGRQITEQINQYPHDLEYEKTFYPFLLMSKKRYVGNLYEKDVNKFERKSMGDALKRRDYAPIVKTIYGGMVDILLNDKDPPKAIKFVMENTQQLLSGKFEFKNFVISKALRGNYKNRLTIAHAVLADRIKKREPGNAPQINDRIPYIYIEYFEKKRVVGNNIEHPDFILKTNLKIDYLYYLEHQIMQPVCQIFDLIIENSIELFKEAIDQEKERRMSHIRKYQNEKKGQIELGSFFKIKEEEKHININLDKSFDIKDPTKKKEETTEKKSEGGLDKWIEISI